MKRLAAFAALATLIAAPAFGQTPEANEIARAATAAKVIAGAACPGCDLFQTDLSYQDLIGRDLSGARLRQADLSLTTADAGKFNKANLSIVNAYGARFQNADFSGADLQDGVFVGAYFSGARFAHARLKGGNFSGAELADAVGLTQAQIDDACGDESTTLPKGLVIARCAP